MSETSICEHMAWEILFLRNCTWLRNYVSSSLSFSFSPKAWRWFFSAGSFAE